VIPEEALGDSDIVDLVTSGRTELFRLLIERHERKVFAMGYSFFHNRDEARDFAQEVFIKAYNALDRFEGRSGFATWLFRIAYNQAVNTKRSAKEYVSLAEGADETAGDAAGEPDRQVLKNVVKEAVREAVRELPEKYRMCVDMSFFYDLTYEEIARVTLFPVNTVKSHILRAKKILREKLQTYYEP
jgi:RNA polymerase sigma-70 factor (ECF subfamily)